MNESLKVTRKFHVARRQHGRKQLHDGVASDVPAGRVPRIARLMALVDLALQEDKISTSIRERVSFHGNVALAQKLQSILADLDFDWEEALAQRSGDVFAFQAHQRVQRLGDWFRQSAESVLQTSSEYLREEARLSPTQVEFEQFQANLTTLKHDVARAEAKYQQLLERIEKT